MNLLAIQRAFDLRRYLMSKFDVYKEYPPNITVRDPVCGKEGKLWVLLEDKKDGVKASAWRCFFCNESGRTPISLVKRVEDCDTFHALEVITNCQKTGVTTRDLRELVMNTLYGTVELEEEWDTAPIIPMELPQEFTPWTRSTQKVPRYFKTRGINIKRAVKYGLGWCDGGYFHNRLIVPVLVRGAVAFWIARYMKPKPPLGVKKTIYPKGAKVNRVLFNYEVACKKERIIIVEDVFSAMHVGANAVASFGTAFSQYQLQLLLQSQAREVVIMWDRDAIDKARVLATRLAEFWNLRVVCLPDARDPDEHTHDDINAMIEASPLMSASQAFRSSVVSRLDAS